MAIAYRNDRPVLTVWGKAVRDSLPTGPSPKPGKSALPPADPALPAVDDGMRWLIDFKAAEDAGMALRLPLADARGFDRIVVLGVNPSAPGDAARRLVELLDAHHYTRGLSLLPQNTPTNNTAQAPAGYGSADRDAEVAYETELGKALVGPLGFDLRLMSWGDGTGVPTSGSNLFIVGTDNKNLLHIRIYDAAGNRVTDTDETKLPAGQAAAIATLKQQLPGLLPPHVLTDAEKAQVIEEATSIVDQTRPLPAPNDRLDGHWLAWAFGIPADVFAHVRYADGMEQRDARGMNRQLWPQDTPWLRKLLVEGSAGGVTDFARQHFSSYVIARGPLPALRVGNQPYGVLPVTSFARMRKRPRPDAEATFVQRLSALQGAWRRADAAAPGITRGSDVVALMAESANSCRFVVQDFANGTPQTPQEIAIADLLPKLLPAATLQSLAPAVAQSLAVESLDACSRRLDAWVASLAVRRLDELRQACPTEIRLGGYGWLEDVRPAPGSWQPVPTPAGVTGPVFQSADNMGFVQAPSLAHAATAAILRSGYLSHRGEGAGNPFAVDLSSDRVRRAEWLLDGVRQGQPIGALLGYQFERRLHEGGLDQYIGRFRTLAGVKDSDELASLYSEVRAKEQLYEEVRALREAAALELAAATPWRTLKEARQKTRQQYQDVKDKYEKRQNQDLPAAITATAKAQAAVVSHRATNPRSVLRRKTINKPGYGNVEVIDAADLVEETDFATWCKEQARLESDLQQARKDEADKRKQLADNEPYYRDAVAQMTRLDDPHNEQSIPAAAAVESQHQQAADALDRQATNKEGRRGQAEQDLAAARLALAQAPAASAG